MAKRKIIQIDEEKCDGCGLCIPNCVEGALQIIDGKARLVSEKYCDGMGACLGHCPQDAITIIEREAEEFNEEAVNEYLESKGETKKDGHQHIKKDHREHIHAHGSHTGFSCPSARVLQFEGKEEKDEDSLTDNRRVLSQLRQWPIQLSLVPTTAPYFQGADLLIAADCVPFAYANFHQDYLKGKALIIGCPKLDDAQFYLEKLTELFTLSDIKSVTIAHMEVPCCFGLVKLVEEAIEASGKNIPVVQKVITVRGDEKSKSETFGFSASRL